ncbi:MAG: DUF4838 domain-containing protein [Lentisphaerae bacterium]|nr:DUF4838 domain-containing protein [Lentisphaerota bacterium]
MQPPRLFVLFLLSTVFTFGLSSLAKDLTPVTLYPAPSHPDLTLVDNGIANAMVVIPADLKPPARTAVTDLIIHLEKMSGAKLKQGKTATEGLITINVAIDPDNRDLFPQPLGPEGFAVKTSPTSITFAGTDNAGAAWAIYDFMERTLNIRWYWPEAHGTSLWLGTSIAESKTITVAPAHWSDEPTFRKREIWPSGGPRVHGYEVGTLHRRLRSYDSWPVRLITHAPHRWDTIYSKTNPEIFQLRGDGKRDYSMLCYGNPKTLAAYLEQIERLIADPKLAADRSISILRDNSVTVSPADIPVACVCPDCRKLWDPQGGQYGTASKVVATFVANLGREVKKRWPDLTVIYLPYKNYTYAPKDVTFPDNVEIQICGMPGLAMYKEPAVNAEEQRNIDAWQQLTNRRIQNWHYSCWPEDRTLAAYLFPDTVVEHYRANRHKTVGSFINGTANHWARQYLTLYVWMKALWNPDVNVQAVIDELVQRQFGPAAATMKTLITMQMKGWQESRWPDAAFSPKTVYEISYPRDDVKKMEALFDEAFALAEKAADPLVKARLDYLAPPLRAFFNQSAEQADGSGLKTLQLIQVAEDPVVDGKLDDNAWRDIEALPFVMATKRDNPTPQFPTTVQAVWTREGITFGFRMTEPEPDKLARDIGAATRDAARIWWDDNVEIFLDPSGRQIDYYQIIVNVNGSVADFYGKDASWDCQGIKAAAVVAADFWSLEVFIPYSAFPNATPPGTGAVWYGNFTRHRVGDHSAREYQRLNTRYAGPSNDQNAFGSLPFVER